MFVGEAGELVALRDIAKGEPISFDYNTTEWDMSCKFKCLCASDKCYRIVQGFKYLNAEQRAAVADQISPFIKWKAEQESEKAKDEAGESLGGVCSLLPTRSTSRPCSQNPPSPRRRPPRSPWSSRPPKRSLFLLFCSCGRLTKAS